MATKKKPLTFQESMDALAQIISDMESGELPLEVSLEKYELAINLTRQCQTALEQAQQKVLILQEKQQGETLDTFHVPDDNA